MFKSSNEKYFDYFLPHQQQQRQQPSSSSSFINNKQQASQLNRTTSLNNYQQFNEPKNQTSDLKFKIEFYVGNFQPNDFKLKLKENNTLVLEATRQILKQNFSLKLKAREPQYKETEHFRRDIKLPEFVLIDTITCYLETYENAPNLLVIEALIDKDINLNNSSSSNTSSNKSNYLTSNDSPDNNVQAYNNRNYFLKSNNEENANNLSLSGIKSNGLLLNENGRTLNNIINSSNKAQTTNLTKLNQQSLNNRPRRSSSLNSNLRIIESSTRNGYLKYKFDLNEFDSKNISISIKNRKTLCITAIKYMVDDFNGQTKTHEFKHDINLPENCELFNIKNSYDEIDGILRIEIPIPLQQANQQNHSTLNHLHLQHNYQNPEKQQIQTQQTNRLFKSIESNLNNRNCCDHNDEISNKPVGCDTSTSSSTGGVTDKYLELMFNLYEFNFDNLDIYTNEKQQKILIIKAYKQLDNYKNSDMIKQNTKTYIRKYILPNWVSNKNINVFQETNDINNVIKNTLIVQLPIIG